MSIKPTLIFLLVSLAVLAESRVILVPMEFDEIQPVNMRELPVEEVEPVYPVDQKEEVPGDAPLVRSRRQAPGGYIGATGGYGPYGRPTFGLNGGYNSGSTSFGLNGQWGQGMRPYYGAHFTYRF